MSDHLYGATLAGRHLVPSLHSFEKSVREMHAVTDAKVVFGRTDIERGANPFAGAIAWLFGFPAGGRSLATAITIVSDGKREIWHRRFAGQPILTRLEAGPGTRTIVERFRYGVAFALNVIETDGRLKFNVAGMRVYGLPVPRFLWPTLNAEEREELHGFRFDIDIGMRWIGRLIHYRGWVSVGLRGEAVKSVKA